MSETEDIMETIRRMSMSEGLTEGGIMKALADAANQLKRSDSQFDRQMRFKEQQVEDAYEARKSTEEQDRMAQWVNVLMSGLKPFGSPEQFVKNYDAKGHFTGREVTAEGVPNILQRLESSYKGFDWRHPLGTTPTKEVPGIKGKTSGTPAYAGSPNMLQKLLDALFGGI